jgi:two-component system cell cycle sensor histidine kinase/response regulator CckA
MLRMIRRVLGDHIELSFAPSADLGSVFGDAGQIEQVLLNLCLNARDAMADGGEIGIRTRPQQITRNNGSPPREYAVLSVSDSGHGMDETVRSHAFEPFFTTKEKGKGTGLGLSTVYGIVQQHDGKIEIQSAPQRGCLIDIYLPISTPGAEHSADPQARNQRPPGGNERCWWSKTTISCDGCSSAFCSWQAMTSRA